MTVQKPELWRYDVQYPEDVIGLENEHFLRSLGRDDLWNGKELLSKKLGRALTKEEEDAAGQVMWNIYNDYVLEDMGR